MIYVMFPYPCKKAIENIMLCLFTLTFLENINEEEVFVHSYIGKTQLKMSVAGCYERLKHAVKLASKAQI